MAKLIQKAKGDGYAFHHLLLAEAAKATAGDKAAVKARFTSVIREGVPR